jgi:dihydrolipoamide dehydrogenase
MDTRKFDVAIIGAGTAGMTAFRAAAAHGKRVLLIESGVYGTTCARVGCMPSKLLISAADAAHAVQNAAAFGVRVQKPAIDGRAVMQRVRAERDRFVGFVVDGVEKIAADQRVHGHAHFVDAHTLQVELQDGRHSDASASGKENKEANKETSRLTVQADSFVIATGSRPRVPEVLRKLGKRLIVNDDVFAWEDLPASVAVIGAGVIGLELGQALHRLGVRVAIFGRSERVAQIGDQHVNQVAVAVLGAELDLRLNVEIVSADLDDDGVVLGLQTVDGKQNSEHFQYVLAAAGRIPNVEQLGLEYTGMALDQRGIPRYDRNTMQCGDSGIFIAGDADADRPILHEAADEGRIAGDNAGRFPAVIPHARHVAMSVAFTDPQIAAIGKTGKQLKESAHEYGEVSFEDQGRSRVILQNHGVLRVYGERGTHRLLGAEMTGPRAEHLAHLLAWACECELTIDKMLAMPFYHPVVEEGLRTALRDLKEKLMRQVDPIEHCTDCTPGV